MKGFNHQSGFASKALAREGIIAGKILGKDITDPEPAMAAMKKGANDFMPLASQAVAAPVNHVESINQKPFANPDTTFGGSINPAKAAFEQNAQPAKQIDSTPTPKQKRKGPTLH